MIGWELVLSWQYGRWRGGWPIGLHLFKIFYFPFEICHKKVVFNIVIPKSSHLKCHYILVISESWEIFYYNGRCIFSPKLGVLTIFNFFKRKVTTNDWNSLYMTAWNMSCKNTTHFNCWLLWISCTLQEYFNYFLND